ncbi:MAG: hypothetical protein ACO1PB_06765 [Ramlibacter sp.]
MKIHFALLLMAAPGWVAAQAGDPLKSPACGQALAALDAARAADPRGAQVAPLRNQATQACLGGGPSPQRSARVLQPPIAVPPPAITPPPAPPTLALPRLPPPPVAIGRAPSPAHCDAGGCWTDDGGRLRHIGPNLAGPNGLCTQQVGQVVCP